MGDRCYSTLVCAERDSDLFEKMGSRLEEAKALSADESEIRGAIVMVDEDADNGHYDELTGLTDTPFLVCNGSASDRVEPRASARGGSALVAAALPACVLPICDLLIKSVCSACRSGIRRRVL